MAWDADYLQALEKTLQNFELVRQREGRRETEERKDAGFLSFFDKVGDLFLLFSKIYLCAKTAQLVLFLVFVCVAQVRFCVLVVLLTLR